VLLGRIDHTDLDLHIVLDFRIARTGHISAVAAVRVARTVHREAAAAAVEGLVLLEDVVVAAAVEGLVQPEDVVVAAAVEGLVLLEDVVAAAVDLVVAEVDCQTLVVAAAVGPQTVP
jgi:hypothetical protein